MPQGTLTLFQTSYLFIPRQSYMLDHELTYIANKCVSRCHAVWDYILELSVEKYTPEMALKILSILDKICSSEQKQMSHTVSKIVRGFQQSVFFTLFLPGFVENMIEESNIR